MIFVNKHIDTLVTKGQKMKFPQIAVAGLVMAGLAGSAQAVLMTDITINGQPYVEGMKISPSVTSLKISGTIVIEAKDNMFPSGRTAGRYPGAGFFAIGTDECVVEAPDYSYTLPDPARCIPNFTVDMTNTQLMSFGSNGFALTTNYDTAKTTFDGAFEKTVPVTSATTSGAFAISYQLNSSNETLGYSMGMLWGMVQPGSAASNHFMPRVTLLFNYRAAAFASADMGAVTAKKLASTITTRQQDEGKKASLFAVAVLPNGQLYSRDSTGGWTLWDGATPFKAVQSGVTLATTHNVAVLSVATNLTGLEGTKVYVGYGLGETDAAAYADLFAGKATSDLIYTVR